MNKIIQIDFYIFFFIGIFYLFKILIKLCQKINTHDSVFILTLLKFLITFIQVIKNTNNHFWLLNRCYI